MAYILKFNYARTYDVDYNIDSHIHIDNVVWVLNNNTSLSAANLSSSNICKNSSGSTAYGHNLKC